MTPRRILLLGWLVFLLYAYPGYLTAASVDQLADSHVGQLTDWYPTMMSELWHLVGFVVSGPAPMLVIQSGLLLGGTFALLRQSLSERTAAIAAACVLVAPPVMAGMAVVCAESQLVGFFIAGVACVTSERARTQLAGLALLVFATAMHPAAIAGTLPPIVFGLAARPAGWRRFALAGGAWLAVVVIALGTSALLVDRATGRNDIAHAAADIAGTLRYAPTMTDDAVRDELAGLHVVPDRELQRQTHRLVKHPDQTVAGRHRLFDAPDSPEPVTAVRWRVIRAHPVAYLRYRAHQLLAALGVGHGRHWSPIYTQFLASPDQRVAVQHWAQHSTVQRALIACVRPFRFLCVPYLYAVLAIVLLPLAIRARRSESTLMAASAIAYMLGLMFTSQEPDYRAAVLVVVCALVAVIPMLADPLASALARARRAGSPPHASSR